MANFSAWDRNNLERVANELLSRLVNNPCEEAVLLKANTEQQAEMNWEFSSDEGRWESFSHQHDDGAPLRWVIRVREDGRFDVSDSDAELCNGAGAFDTLAAAKAFCNSSESTSLSL